MKKVVLALLMFGCGDGLPDKDFGRECGVHDEMYSVSIPLVSKDSKFEPNPLSHGE